MKQNRQTQNGRTQNGREQNGRKQLTKTKRTIETPKQTKTAGDNKNNGSGQTNASGKETNKKQWPMSAGLKNLGRVFWCSRGAEKRKSGLLVLSGRNSSTYGGVLNIEKI